MAPRFSAILCDDVRREDTGKFIVVGAYLGNLGAFEFPVEDDFYCLVRVDDLPSNAKSLKVIMKHIGYKEDIKEYDISENESRSMIISIRGAPLKAKVPGDFFVEVAIDSGRRRKIERIAVFDSNDAESIDAM